MQNQRFRFFIITLISSMGQLMSDLYLPALPAIQQALHTNIHWVQCSISAFMIGFAITPVIYGPLSDGIGRRKPLIFGMSLSLLGTFVCISAHNIDVFILGRVLQGLGTGSCSALMRSVMRDVFHGETLIRYISYSSLIGVLILCAGPLFGSVLLSYYGWQSNFIFLGLYTGIALLAYILFVPETNHFRHPDNLQPRQIMRNIGQLFSSKRYLSYALFSASAYGCIIAWLTVGPIILQLKYHFTAIQVGYVTFMTGISFGVGALANSYLVKQLGCDNMIKLGFYGVLFSGVSLCLLQITHVLTPGLLLVMVVIIFISSPMIFPNSSIGSLAIFARITGNASAFYALLQVCGGFVSSSILAYAHDASIIPMALVITVFSFTALCVHRRVIAPHSQAADYHSDANFENALDEAFGSPTPPRG